MIFVSARSAKITVHFTRSPTPQCATESPLGFGQTRLAGEGGLGLVRPEVLQALTQDGQERLGPSLQSVLQPRHNIGFKNALEYTL